MANDLRIPVTVTDGFSGPLAKLRTQMQQVANTSGIRALNADWKRVEGSVINVTREVASLTPMFSGLGIASMGLGAGIAAAAIGVRNFALGARDMSLFGRETGVAVEKLRVLEAVGRRYGVSADQVRSNAQGAADSFDQIRRRIGGLYQDLRARGEFNLAESLVGSKDVNQYMDRVFDAASKMSNPKRRQEFLRNALGSDDFSKVINELGPRWRQFFGEVQERIGAMPAGAEAAAQKFNDAMEKMNDAMEKVRVNSMGPLLEMSAKLIETWEKPVGSELLKFMQDMKSAFGNLNAAGTAWKNGDYFGMLKALNGGQPILRDMSAPLAGSNSKAQTATADRLSSVKDRLDKLNSAIDGGRITGGARDNAMVLRDRLQDEIKRLTDELVKLREQGATVQQQSFGGGGFGAAGLIHNAAFGGFGGGVGGPIAGMKAWYDFKRGGGSAGSSGGSGGIPAIGTTGSGAQTGDHRLDAIIAAEGTAKGGRDPFNTVLGYGRYGSPSKPLTDMTLDEAYAFGRQVRSRHGSSSALGAFQIVGTTMRDMQKRLGLPGSTLFNRETQIALARKIWEVQGPGAWEGFKHHPQQRAKAMRGGAYDLPSTAAGGHDVLSGAYAKERGRNFPDLWARRASPGDEMMQTAARAAGGLHNPAKVEGSATLTIDINGLPSPNFRARTSLDGMFKDVKLHAGKTQMLPEGVDI